RGRRGWRALLVLALELALGGRGAGARRRGDGGGGRLLRGLAERRGHLVVALPEELAIGLRGAAQRVPIPVQLGETGLERGPLRLGTERRGASVMQLAAIFSSES